ncbi:hypothetical protein [Naasia aerilata]|uniref:Right handed beta helix domain-containing protein n=1 Tax=Naasia aerilata TaxID=1162966 RepID=A0ABN6XRF7_9MICO|nr:hypothetical protein [Naasia aerilata]BDZ46235.1 hypothetical protein GCM10025866_21440 [Naasia aerilata]
MDRRWNVSAITGGIAMAAVGGIVAAAALWPSAPAPEAAAETTAIVSTTPTSTAPLAPIVRDSFTVTPAPVTSSSTSSTTPTTTTTTSTAGTAILASANPDTLQCAPDEEAIPSGEEGYACGPADLPDPGAYPAPGDGGGTTVPAPPAGGTGSLPGTGTPKAGVPAGTTLRLVTGDQTITTPGTVLDGLDIHGRVIVKAANVTIKNSIIRGTDAGGKYGLVDNMSGSVGLKIYDSEIVATNPNWTVNGIMGWNFELHRVNIHNTVDQVSIAGSNVLVADSWLHGNLWYANDPDHTDGSHDDNIETVVGDNIVITGNVLEGASNAAIMITQGRGLMSNVTIANNRMDNGDCTVNVSTKGKGPIAGFSVTGNVFGLNTTIKRCAVYSPDSPIAMSGNTYTDGVAALLRVR